MNLGTPTHEENKKNLIVVIISNYLVKVTATGTVSNFLDRPR